MFSEELDGLEVRVIEDIYDADNDLVAAAGTVFTWNHADEYQQIQEEYVWIEADEVELVLQALR